jgi:hypothetical protein
MYFREGWDTAGGAPARAGFPFGTDAAELLRAEGLS